MMVDAQVSPFIKRLPSGWSLRRFGDLLAEPVRNGVYKKKEFHGRGQKIINMGELFAYDFIREQEMKRVELNTRELDKDLVRDGDLLFARRSLVLEGSGKCSLVVSPPEDTTFESSIIRARPDQDVADPRFYYYLFRSPLGRALMASIATRTAVSGITGSNLVQLYVPHPSLSTQRKIASILSAYDDLIENNTRRIQILEEMARTIYREWFVEFRAPGVKLRKATAEERKVTGKDVFPVGWEMKPIGEVVETLGGGTPSTKNGDYWENGDIIWFTPSDLTAAKAMFIAESSKKITRLGFEKSSARLFSPYSVMMTSRATIGVVAINTQEACTNQGFITCIPNERVSAYQIYFWMEQNKEKIISVASGATYKEINRGEFRELPIVVTDETLRERFVEILAPIAKQIENLLNKNENLRRTRDLLLPRLVSGEIDVEGSQSSEPLRARVSEL